MNLFYVYIAFDESKIKPDFENGSEKMVLSHRFKTDDLAFF